MELPPLKTTAASAQPAKTGEVKLSTLVSELEGLKLSAVVKSLADVPIAQKQALLKAWLDDTSQQKHALPNQAASTGSSQISAPPQTSLGGLLKSANLKMLLLQFQTTGTKLPPSLPQSLHVLTNTAIKPGSTVGVQVRSDGNLQLEANRPSTNSSLDGARDLARASLPTQNEILNSGLRKYLPYEQPLAKQFSLLSKLSAQLTHLPLASREQVIDRPLLQSLVKLTQVNTASSYPLITPQALKTAIQLSGHFLEQGLIKSKATTPAAETSAVIKPEAIKPEAIVPSGQAKEINRDTKAQLLEVFQQASAQVSSPTALKASSGLQQQLQNAANYIRNADSLLNLLGQPLAKSSSKQANLETREQIARVLMAASALGVARISAQQIRQLLGSELAGTAPLSLEIPIKTQDGVLPLFLQLQQQPIAGDEEERHTKQDKKKTKRRVRWQIYMEMELVEDNDKTVHFAAEVALVEKHLKTRLWADSDTLKNRAGERISKLKSILEAKGLEVDDIILEPGNPPGKSQTIAQNLIDIRT